MPEAFRIEHDFLGELAIEEDRLYGIHTLRALENFPLAGRPVHPELVCAFGQVKLACAQANRRLGSWQDDPEKADAIERACREMGEGLLTGHVLVDLLQGGAGTSSNMNVNEVLANRALEILGEERGSYGRVSPLDDINLHQSTNDTYPTALKLAAIRRLRVLESKIVSLQEEFQILEKRFAHVVKVGRTQLQDAVLTTLGREMSAYAEALNRDRWRIYKCEERLRVINLGGTAIGTGLSAPRDFIFTVTDILRANTSIGFARAENLIDNTQNADVFVEVSGMSEGLRLDSAENLHGPAAHGERPRERVCRDYPAPAPGRVFDNAGESQPGDPGGGKPGRNARLWSGRLAHLRLRFGEPRTQSFFAACSRMPARQYRPACQRLRYFVPALCRRDRSRRGTVQKIR